MQPTIVIEGLHNANLDVSISRLKKASSYKDLSTVILCPTRGLIPDRVVQSWMNLMRPMNQKVIGPIFVRGYEVGDAYSLGIEMVLNHPDLSQFNYLLTIEEDNLPPPDGLLRLYESIEGNVDGQKYDCVGGLYWTKGPEGQPMCYGDPQVMPKNFIPQIPQPDKITPANGLGMGFNLFRMSMFRDERIERPWFRTIQEIVPGVGARAYTQDLMFYENAGKWGYRFACDSRVRVGHLDPASDTVW